MLKSDFVLGWKNIIKEDYVGESHGYSKEQTAVGTTNGAGPTNTQMTILSPDGTVLHCLPGFWHPKDLAVELKFAKKLLKLWNDESKSDADKKKEFSKLQLDEVKNHSTEMTARSGWQGFDKSNEMKRAKQGPRDTFVANPDSNKKPVLKTINVLIHDRMATRPFLKWEDFDIGKFSDYGRPYYDNNKKVDGKGETFLTPGKLKKAKKKQDKIAAREAKKLEKQAQRMAKKKAKMEARKAKALEKAERKKQGEF